ncbi:hypothetical protein GGI04_002443 [Coemansia thaxteri]|nr:hypothetical protein GGI04_002443 [Coemansia thaxteri]
MPRLPLRQWQEPALTALVRRSPQKSVTVSSISAGAMDSAGSSSSSDTSSSGVSALYKAIYALLVVVWVAIVVGVLYMAARRYRRNQLLRAQGIGADTQSLPGAAPKRTKRLLAKDQVMALPVVTLTEEDILSSKRLATAAHSPHCTPPAPPDPIPNRQSHAACTLLSAKPSPAITNVPDTIALPSPTLLATESSLHTSPAAMSPAPEQHTAIAASASVDAAAVPLHEENCAVCLEDFTAGDEVRRLPCRHFFHIACIDPWLSERSATCPLCNFDVSGFPSTSNA